MASGMTISMKMMKRYLLQVVFLCVSVGAVSMAPVRAEEAPGERQPLVVALDGSGQYRSIQEAVDAAKKLTLLFSWAVYQPVLKAKK